MENRPQSAVLPSGPLGDFVRQVTSAINENSSEELVLPQVASFMKTLVQNDNWLGEEFCKPHPEYYQQYLLYADPDDRFSVVSFVWGPGQATPIHDHTVWGVIGMLRGSEYAQAYDVALDGMQPKPKGETQQLQPGDVECVSPTLGDVHKVWNAFNDRVSVSVHAYGANIGKVSRHVYPADGAAPKTFISGYSNVN